MCQTERQTDGQTHDERWYIPRSASIASRGKNEVTVYILAVINYDRHRIAIVAKVIKAFHNVMISVVLFQT